MEKLTARLNKQKWFLPKMSYRGKVLIINNLGASMLWHKQACARSFMVDFFCDKLHWTPQGVLFLPKSEGGQTLINRVSRATTCILQFIQWLLYDLFDLIQRAVAKIILQGMGGMRLELTLFMVNCPPLSTSFRTSRTYWHFIEVFLSCEIFSTTTGSLLNPYIGSLSTHWSLGLVCFLGSHLFKSPDDEFN